MERRAHAARGVIFDIDNFSTHDGPGIRTVVYVKGCPLRCLWCHSPESQRMEPEPVRLIDRCVRCDRCLEARCPNSAWSLCGREVGVSEILEEVLCDKVFFESSGGGVTLTGGEVLYQPLFACALLSDLRQGGVHTVVETSGMGRWEDLAALSIHTDLFYYDIKAASSEKHLRFTGANNGQILENLSRLAALRRGKGIVLRAPMIPGYNDSDEDVRSLYALASDRGLKEVHLLPYNISASAKYEWLGRIYEPGDLPRQSEERLLALRALAPEGFMVTIQ